MLDTRLHVQTPEGIELTLTPAGLLPRSLAWLIDFIIRFIVNLVFVISASIILEDLAAGLISIGYFVIAWLYTILFEVYNDGKTPGKSILQIQVVNTNGSPVDFGGAVLRNLIRVVDALPAFYLIGASSTLFTKKFQRLGDIVAGTYVVYIEPARQITEVVHTTERPLALNLRAADQRAIMRLDERIVTLSDERSSEIAGLLSDFIPGSSDKIREKLREHARWLVGGSK